MYETEIFIMKFNRNKSLTLNTFNELTFYLLICVSFKIYFCLLSISVSTVSLIRGAEMITK